MMEKHAKSGSFIGRHRWRSTNIIDSPRSTIISPKPTQPAPPPQYASVNPHQILIQIDEHVSPDLLDDFSIIIMSKTRKLDEEIEEEDAAFLQESVKRLCKLKRTDKVNSLLHRTMMFMEQQLRLLLLLHPRLRPAHPPEVPRLKVMSSKHFSFKTTTPERCSSITNSNSKDNNNNQAEQEEEEEEEEFPGFSEAKMIRMENIITTMISAGYKNECSNVYCMARGNALYEQLKRLDFEKLNADDLHRLNWDWLEADISRWIRIIKHCSDVLIPAENKLGNTLFSHHLSVFRGLFVNLIRSVTTSLLDYAAAVAMTKRSAERLFKFLDMYEALDGLSEALISDDHHQLKAEISSVNDRIANGAVNMLGDLENSIRNDVAKTPVPGGAVHPLTRYVLNYVKYACEYGDTLEEIFRSQNAKQLPADQVVSADHQLSPLAAQIMSVMSLLDGNLAVKSTLYKDPSLRYIFLMNNGRYILQKVKGSNEIKKLMGDNWCRRRSSEVRHYHKSYQRETWTRLLQCITQEGIQVNGKINKQLLKERFKNFNAMFDEIHKTQTTWVVSEEQLLSELRASISGVVVPAYRSFVGRYKHHLEAGRSMDRYIKYQTEDIEALIETLFEGNHTSSMSRKRF